MGKRILLFLFSLTIISMLGSLGCGSGSSSSTSSNDALNVTSLSSVPNISDIVNTGSSSSSSLSARYSTSAIRSNAVSGTPPVLKDISGSTADTLFWDGLISQILASSVDVSDPTVRDRFWQGEMACRMAQNVGFEIQNLEQSGTSLCYMKNAPGASSGVTITSGDATATNLFDQPTSGNRLVQVNSSGNDQGRDETIYINVIGKDDTSNGGNTGYAVDLWFCGQSATPGGYQKIRINNSTGAITVTELNGNENHTFTSNFSGFVTQDSSGNIVFDESQARTALSYFTDSSFEGKSSLSVLGDVISAKQMDQFSGGDFSGGGKQRIQSQFSGNTILDVRFLAAGVAMQWSGSGNQETSVMSGGVEYQSDHYVGMDVSLLADDLSHVGGILLSDYSFSDDDFYSSLAADSTITGALSNYTCSGLTPDVVVAMDMSDPAMETVRTTCESHFENMNFCDSQEIMMARSVLIQQQFQH